MSSEEQKYATIECLAIVFACRTFDRCIYGHGVVTIQSDRKPPEAIFRKSLLEAPKRLQYYDRNAHDLSPLRKGTPGSVLSLKTYDASKWALGMVADQCSNRSYIVEIDFDFDTIDVILG